MVAAVLKVSGGRGYFSKHLLADGELAFYDQECLWPQGVNRNMPSVQDWAMRMGLAIARLATWP